METRCRTRLLRALLVTSFTVAATWAWAETGDSGTAPTGLESGVEQQVRQLALEASSAGKKGAPRVEVSLGQLDSRLRLAPCSHVEAYLPDGARAWGKTHVGLRCTQGAVKWNVYLPITVKVFGKALVATDAIGPGATIEAANLAQGEVDLAEDPSAAITNTDLAIGRTTTRALKPGQSIRQSHLRARQWFSAGEIVTVSAQGPGFVVAGEGEALNNGIEGQPVKVRTESGRILTGQPVGDRRVELPM